MLKKIIITISILFYSFIVYGQLIPGQSKIIKDDETYTLLAYIDNSDLWDTYDQNCFFSWQLQESIFENGSWSSYRGVTIWYENSGLFDFTRTSFDNKTRKFRVTRHIHGFTHGSHWEAYIHSNEVFVAKYSFLNEGVIKGDETIGHGDTPMVITPLVESSLNYSQYNTPDSLNLNDSISYKWYRSTTSPSSGFSYISGANSEEYQPNSLTSTTYYKRRSFVGSEAKYTNTVEKGVFFSPGNIQYTELAGYPITICYATMPSDFEQRAWPSGGYGNYTYQWQKTINPDDGWSDITGETDKDFSPNILYSDTYFRCAVTTSDDTNSETKFTNSIYIHVLSESNGGSIPENIFICNGDDSPVISYSNFPFSNGDVEYFVEYSNDNTNWNIFSDSYFTGDPYGFSYSLDAVSSPIFIRFSFIDRCGKYSSNVLSIQFYNNVNGGEIGNDQSICYHANFNPIVNIDNPSGGNGSWQYKWYFKNANDNDFTLISGATSNEYTPNEHFSYNEEVNLIYYRESSNLCGSANSNFVYVNMVDDINSGSIGHDHEICHNSIPDRVDNLEYPTGGIGSWVFSWQKKSINGNWQHINNETNAFIDIDELVSSIFVRRLETNQCGIVNSQSVFIDVAEEFSPGTIGNNQVKCDGGAYEEFSDIVSPNGTIGNINYTWYFSNDPNGPWNIAEGASNDNSYTPVIVEPGIKYFMRETSNICGTEYSNVLSFELLEAFKPNFIGYNQTIDYGTSPNELVTIYDAEGGSSEYTYQWQIFDDNLKVTWENILDAYNIDYQPSNLYDTTLFRLRVRDAVCADTFSNVISINVYPDLLPGEIGEDQFICYNDEPYDIIETAEPVGGNGSYSFAWESRVSGGDWTSIVDAVSPFLSDFSVEVSSFFRRLVSSGSISKYSNVVFVEKGNTLNQPSVDGDGLFCLGDDVSMFSNDVNASNFFWLVNGDTLNSDNYSINGVTSDFDFEVWFADADGCFSPKYFGSVNIDPIQAAFSQSHSVIDVGDKIDFSANSPNAVAFEWDFSFGDSHFSVNPSIFFNTPGTFDVSLLVTSDFGCSSSIEKIGAVTVNSTSNVALLNDFDFKVFPSPSNGIFFVDAPVNVVNGVAVVDVLGNFIVPKVEYKKGMSISLKKKGIFVVFLYNDNSLVGNAKIIIH